MNFPPGHWRLLLCCLLLIVFNSCKKNVAPLTDNRGEGNPTSYLLEEINSGDPSFPGGSDYYFRYNQNNLVSEVKRVIWGYVTYNNDPPVRQENILTYTFEYANQLAVKCTIRDGLARWTYDYDYIGDQIVKKTTRYADGNVQDSTLYQYDAQGNLTIAAVYNDKLKYKDEFTYDHDLISSTYYKFYYLPEQKSKVEYYGFDKRINFIRTINGLPKRFVDEVLVLFPVTSAAGNFTQLRYSSAVGLNEDFGTLKNSYYSYEYNEEGLPTRISHSSFIQVMKYRKYK